MHNKNSVFKSKNLNNMKRIISVLSLILVYTTVYSKPESFSYQTVIRNSSWNVLANQNVGIEISILEDFASNNSL